MRRMRRIGLVIYLVAACMVVGACVGSLFGPYTERISALVASGSGRITMAACLTIVALNMLAVLIFLFVDRPEPTCLRLDGDADIEVTTDALASIARTAASERDVMVEDVRVRIAGRDKARVDISIEAILLARCDIESVAHRVQHRVQTACDDMLGVSGARVRVRFLPSTTETITKEAAGER